MKEKGDDALATTPGRPSERSGDDAKRDVHADVSVFLPKHLRPLLEEVAVPSRSGGDFGGELGGVTGVGAGRCRVCNISRSKDGREVGGEMEKRGGEREGKEKEGATGRGDRSGRGRTAVGEAESGDTEALDGVGVATAGADGRVGG